MSIRPIDIALREAARRKWNQSRLAEQIGATPADITNWKSRGMPPQWHARVAEALDITIDELNGRVVAGVGEARVLAEAPTAYAQQARGADRVRLSLVPVVGTAKMGSDGYYEEFSSIPGAGDGVLEIATRDPGAYGVRLRGMSMYPAIRDGWYAAVEPSGTVHEGEYVMLKLTDGRKMVKELLFRRPDAIEVLSVNGDQRMRIEHAELESMEPIGAIVPPSKWRPL